MWIIPLLLPFSRYTSSARRCYGCWWTAGTKIDKLLPSDRYICLISSIYPECHAANGGSNLLSSPAFLIFVLFVICKSCDYRKLRCSLHQVEKWLHNTCNCHQRARDRGLVESVLSWIEKKNKKNNITIFQSCWIRQFEYLSFSQKQNYRFVMCWCLQGVPKSHNKHLHGRNSVGLLPLYCNEFFCLDRYIPVSDM